MMVVDDVVMMAARHLSCPCGDVVEIRPNSLSGFTIRHCCAWQPVHGELECTRVDVSRRMKLAYPASCWREIE